MARESNIGNSPLERLMSFRFHPDKGFKLKWDLLIIFLSVINSYLLPLQFSLTSTFNDLVWLNIFDTVVDWIFILDIFTNFITIYIDPKSDAPISNFKRIFWHYVKGQLVLDLLASIPFDSIIQLFDNDQGQEESQGGKFLSMLKLTRLLRLRRMI